MTKDAMRRLLKLESSDNITKEDILNMMFADTAEHMVENNLSDDKVEFLFNAINKVEKSINNLEKIAEDFKKSIIK